MLSYKEYKLLNESLYGAFNLGLKNPNVVGGIVSGSSINGTEAAIEAESEEALEEAKKMKKKMDCGSEDEEDMEKKVSDEEVEDEDSEEEGDEEESEEESDEEEGDEEEEEKEPEFMKKKMLKGDQHKLDRNKNGKIDAEDFKILKKKSKKEWSEIVSDLESFLEDVSEEDSLMEIKKGLELIKEGMKKGKHKEDCGCPFCKKSEAKKDDKEESDDDKEEGKKGLTAAQKKLPEALQKAILAKQGKGKSEDKKCGKMMDKKCGKYMNEEEQAWWDSVNGMLNADPDQKNWDGGWSEVGEVQQAVRENTEELKKKVISEVDFNTAMRAGDEVLSRELERAKEKGEPANFDRFRKFRNHAEKRNLGLSGMVFGAEQAQMTINQIDVGMSKSGWLSSAKPNSITLSCDFGTENERRMAHNFGKIIIDLKSKTLTCDARGFENIQFERTFAMRIVQAINEKAGGKVVDMTFFKTYS